VREIVLTQGKVALVDDEDYPELAKHRWHAVIMPPGLAWYAIRNIKRPDGRRATLSMHRAILAAPRGQRVDHKNRDGLDNRRENLRFATAAQNAQNRVRGGRKTSRFIGVSWYAPTSRWKAQIQSAGKKMGLGYFLDEEAAARVWDAAAMHFFGAFAVLNFPREQKAS
jgi:hypothetical protein